jgi:RNA polymerase sigma-70 factor (ECF subfamily)
MKGAKLKGIDLNASRFFVFEEYYNSYSQAVYANIRKMVADPVLAQDVLQDVFVALWEHREQLDPERIPNWLFVVSYNKSISCLKKNLRESTTNIPVNSISTDIIQEVSFDEDLYSSRLSILEEAIEKLPSRKKQVFRLCKLEGHTAEEVAELLGISVASVRDYLKQATRFIRSYVKQYYPNAEAAGLALLMFFISA